MNNTTPANVLTAVGWGSSGAVGLVGNGVLVAILSKEFRNSKPYEKVIFATLITDLFTCFGFAFIQPYAILGRVTFFCKSAALFFCLFLNMNQVWIAVNMISRYMALYHQQMYKKWFSTQGIIVCYGISIMVNLPVVVPLIYYDVLGLNNMGLCGVNPINTITTMCALSGQVFPIVSNVICLVFGYLVIKKIRGHISQVASLDSSLVEESRQIVILVTVSSMIPILIQSPTTLIRILQYFITVNPWYSRALTSIFPLVPASAPFVTAFIIKPYRKKVMKLFKSNKTTTTSVVRINVVNC